MPLYPSVQDRTDIIFHSLIFCQINTAVTCRCSSTSTNIHNNIREPVLISSEFSINHKIFQFFFISAHLSCLFVYIIMQPSASNTWYYFFRHLKEILTYFLKRTQWAGIADFLQSPPIISLYFVILISFLTSLRILS